MASKGDISPSLRLWDRVYISISFILYPFSILSPRCLIIMLETIHNSNVLVLRLGWALAKRPRRQYGTHKVLFPLRVPLGREGQ